MKKLLIIMCLFLLVGCNDNNTDKPNDNEIKYLTKDEISEELYNYGIEIYSQKKYETLEKTNGEYFISLNALDDLEYDISKFLNPGGNHESCDKEKTGIVIDIDNVRKVDYKEYPIMVSIYCD
jgi:hypothetical protein